MKSIADKNKTAQALTDFAHALKLNPTYAAAYRGRGLAYLQQSNIGAAVAALNEALRIEPNDPSTRYARGLAQSQRGAYGQALSDFEYAITALSAADAGAAHFALAHRWRTVPPDYVLGPAADSHLVEELNPSGEHQAPFAPFQRKPESIAKANQPLRIRAARNGDPLETPESAASPQGRRPAPSGGATDPQTPGTPAARRLVLEFGPEPNAVARRGPGVSWLDSPRPEAGLEQRENSAVAAPVSKPAEQEPIRWRLDEEDDVAAHAPHFFSREPLLSRRSSGVRNRTANVSDLPRYAGKQEESHAPERIVATEPATAPSAEQPVAQSRQRAEPPKSEPIASVEALPAPPSDVASAATQQRTEAPSRVPVLARRRRSDAPARSPASQTAQSKTAPNHNVEQGDAVAASPGVVRLSPFPGVANRHTAPPQTENSGMSLRRRPVAGGAPRSHDPAPVAQQAPLAAPRGEERPQPSIPLAAEAAEAPDSGNELAIRVKSSPLQKPAPRQPAASENMPGAKAFSLLASGEFAEAEREFDKWIEADRESAEALAGRAEARLELGNRDGALADADAAIKLDANRVEAYAVRIAAYATQGQHAAVIDDCHHLLRLRPDNAAVYGHLGLGYLEQREYRRAAEAFGEQLKRDGEDANAYFLRGVASRKMGAFDAAIADLDRAIALDDTMTQAYLQRGLAQEKAGKLAEAVDDFSVVTRREPSHSQNWHTRGMAYMRQGAWPEAAEDFSKALDLDRNFGSARMQRGLVRMKMDDAAGAIQDFTAALSLGARPLAALRARAEAYIAQRDFARAVTDCDEALKRDPNDAAAYSRRGLAKLYLADDAGAIADLTTALRLNGKDAEALANRAIAFINRAEFQKAIDDCTRAVALKPDSPDVFRDRGAAYCASRRVPGSIGRLHRVDSFGARQRRRLRGAQHRLLSAGRGRKGGRRPRSGVVAGRQER